MNVDDQPPADQAALRLHLVHAAYDRTPAVEGVTGQLERGQSLALIGPNGAGKSTLIKAILGLVPLTGGTIEVLGRRPEVARPAVAYVPQADVLDATFPVSVLDVVLMGRYRAIGWFRRPRLADRQRAREALHAVGLADLAARRFGSLSGGERQRVLLARAIAQEARLLLLDEPFNGVDATSTELILSILADLRADGVAIVMSTHDLSIAHLACDEACLLNRRQVAFGAIDTALTPELLRETYGASTVQLVAGSAIATAE
jgi:manganese/iron transport system ATP-binding protein